MAFEQLMAEAAAKKGKDDKKRRKGKKEEVPAGTHGPHHSHTTDKPFEAASS